MSYLGDNDKTGQWIDGLSATMTVKYRRYFQLKLYEGWMLHARGPSAGLQRRYQNVLFNRSPDCLLNRLFRRRSTETSKLCVTGLCEGNSPVTGEFPAQRPVSRETFRLWLGAIIGRIIGIPVLNSLIRTRIILRYEMLLALDKKESADNATQTATVPRSTCRKYRSQGWCARDLYRKVGIV